MISALVVTFLIQETALFVIRHIHFPVFLKLDEKTDTTLMPVL